MDVEIAIDASQVNTDTGWRDVKVAVFAQREAGEPITLAEWAERELPVPSVRTVVATIEEVNGIPPVPAMGAALAYFDDYRTARLLANLLQAQRDYFGAHNYERTDKPAGEFFHTNWTGRGGTTASTTYNA